ncbi:MAG TPA: DUF4382 domain-containing protein [Spirochaetota bacterium]|nr:DUF4382 domain-containing protein [Spirochaetota bacterium]HPJ41756.1 DUF4382 domain-containing protein [Spirochaetota bacterium]
MKKIMFSTFLIISLSALFLSSCTKAPEGSGTIIFTANGEDFVREGFVSKDGWQISFDKVYVNIVDPTAYNKEGLKSKLQGAFFTDLAAGDAKAEPVLVGQTEKVLHGNYQSLKFGVKKAASGDYKGASIVMIGTAKKGGKTANFVIKLDEEMDFDGKEGFVGDEVKGVLAENGKTTVEMTFHFDHIFGDKEAAATDHINTGSVGFDFFNAYAKDGKVEVTQEMLKKSADYGKLINAIATLGHLGEGHCEVSNMTSASYLK